MILNGKAERDFCKWVFEKHNIQPYNIWNKIFLNALIIDWFDSVGIYINIEPFYYKKQLYFKQYVLGYKDINEQNTYFKRTDATEEAIKKANEIYNKN